MMHLEVLPPDQRNALRHLGPAAKESGFYLGGGTAVAVHLGHRQSLDLDWFTGDRVDQPLALATDFQSRGIDFRVGSVQRGTLHGEVGGVRVSFLEFRSPMLKPPLAWPAFDCSLASLDDLVAMKLLAVAQRGTKKDFLDVYALGGQGFSLREMLDLYRQKFAVADVARVLSSLCYFDDADPEPMPTMAIDVRWERVKDTIRSWVKSTVNSAGLLGGPTG
jgi:hypothetical protein